MSIYINFLKLQELLDNGSAIATIEHDALSNESTITINTRTPDNLFIRKEKKEMPSLSWEEHLIGITNDYRIFFESSCKTNKNKIKRVIFSNPMTIIIWEDGKKTYAKTTEDDEYDPFRGFLLCYAKKNLRKEVTQYKDFLFNRDSKSRYFIEHLIKGKYRDWKTYEKEVLNLYFKCVENKKGE